MIELGTYILIVSAHAILVSLTFLLMNRFASWIKDKSSERVSFFFILGAHLSACLVYILLLTNAASNIQTHLPIYEVEKGYRIAIIITAIALISFPYPNAFSWVYRRFSQNGESKD